MCEHPGGSGKHPADRRERDVGIVLGAEQACPRVKDLDEVGPSLDLKPQEVRYLVGQPEEQATHQIGVAVGQSLKVSHIPRASTLHQVGRQGQGGSSEADESSVWVDPRGEQLNYIRHVAQGR